MNRKGKILKDPIFLEEETHVLPSSVEPPPKRSKIIYLIFPLIFIIVSITFFPSSSSSRVIYFKPNHATSLVIKDMSFLSYLICCDRICTLDTRGTSIHGSIITIMIHDSQVMTYSQCWIHFLHL
jgi:hypothetical protein